METPSAGGRPSRPWSTFAAVLIPTRCPGKVFQQRADELRIAITVFSPSPTQTSSPFLTGPRKIYELGGAVQRRSLLFSGSGGSGIASQPPPGLPTGEPTEAVCTENALRPLSWRQAVSGCMRDAFGLHFSSSFYYSSPEKGGGKVMPEFMSSVPVSADIDREKEIALLLKELDILRSRNKKVQ